MLIIILYIAEMSFQQNIIISDDDENTPPSLTGELLHEIIKHFQIK